MRFHKLDTKSLDAIKLDYLARRLKEDFPYFTDDLRTDFYVWSHMTRWFGGIEGLGTHLSFEYDDFNGILLFKDIIPGHKCDMFWIHLNKKMRDHSLVREADKVMGLVMKWFKLHKIEAGTADSRVARMLERLGFHQEGVRKDSFLFDGELYDFYLMGREHGTRQAS
jgi:RimJ/RimL family protein N-acetyltransferase